MPLCTKLSVEFIYVDNTLIVINKPAGMLSVPGRGLDKQDCAFNKVLALYGDALVVHRLDMATSGLLLFARGKENQRLLSMAFANRLVGKTYIAHVKGFLKESTGIIELPLAADWPNRPKQKVCYERGKPSITQWRLLDYSPEHAMSVLELTPITGRTHQLRVHLAAIGYPILGDRLYAPDELITPYSRLMLHANGLKFMHPCTQEVLEFHCDTDFVK